jgi:hypothetical protein
LLGEKVLEFTRHVRKAVNAAKYQSIGTDGRVLAHDFVRDLRIVLVMVPYLFYHVIKFNND